MLEDIKKTLWASADKLRANMDAAEYKHLVLGLIFVKYISDAFVARQTELTQRLRDNLTVDWSERESVRAKLRLMVKRILKKYKYPPDQQDGAVQLILEQAQALGEAWGA